MAKVKIQGNASGTGVLTVTAPNTSTDRTITLPDATGTLLNSDGSGANLTGLPNGSQLDHSGSKKIEATSTGVDVTGIAVTDGITSSGNITFDNGNSSVSIKSDGADGSYIQFGSNEYLRFLYDNGASESIRLIDGGGITFNGDTAAANALDDYEEGTWTPALSGVTGTFATSGTLNYTKVGRIVTLNGYIYNCASISNTSANWLFSGLPFAPIQDCQGAVSTYNVTLTSSNSYVTIRAAANNSSLALVESRAGTVGVLIPFSAVGTGHLDFTITYATNA